MQEDLISGYGSDEHGEFKVDGELTSDFDVVFKQVYLNKAKFMFVGQFNYLFDTVTGDFESEDLNGQF